MAEEKTRLKNWAKKEKEEGEINHEKIAREIWDKLQHADHFALEKAFLVKKIDEIYEKGKADQKALKKGKK